MVHKDLARLNVEIPKDLLKQAKQRALDTDKDLRTVVIDALQAALGKQPKRGGKS